MLIAFVATLTTVGSFTVGCADKSTSAGAPAPTTGQAAAGQPGTVKPTAEQEAAKEKAIKDGPAIEAAIRQQQQSQ